MATSYQQPPNFDLERFIAEDEYVTALGTIMLPDQDGGAEVKYAYCDVWQFRDGKMAGLKAFVTKF